jgi:serine protease Do
VCTDPQTDIAFIKIDAKGLPFMPMSDSSRVQVGDLALAIGNPFGIGQTVTMGIIGATGRSGLNIEAYEDFIQTDAAINPGNSGGALINSRGELIGINTAILARGGGGNQGVGFAVPINMARNVKDQIVKTGKVTRGWLGISIQEVTPALARGFGLKEPGGVAVTGVEPNTPAARAGIATGDVITALNGQSITDLNSFRLKVASTPPGTEIRLKLFREGRDRETTIKLGEFPVERASARSGTPGRDAENRSLEGVTVETLTPQIARQLRIPASTTGVIVSDIGQGSPAFAAGLRRGDVIEEVNRRKVTSASEFESAIAAAGKNSVLLLVNRGGRTTFIAVEQR